MENSQFNTPENETGMDVKKLFVSYLRYWYYFIISVLVCFFAAHYYLKHTTLIYQSDASIKIIDDSKNTFTLPTGNVVMTFKLPEQRGGVNEGVNVGVNVGVNALFAYIQANPGHRAGEMASSFKLTQRTIERWLKQLREAGKIEFIGSPKTGGYYPKQ